MENISEAKKKRLKRNKDILKKYVEEMKTPGSMSSVVVSKLANKFGVSIPTIYSALNGFLKKGDK